MENKKNNISEFEYEIIRQRPNSIEPEIFSVKRTYDGVVFSLGNFVNICLPNRHKVGPIPITRIFISESNDEIIIETGSGFENQSKYIQVIDGLVHFKNWTDNDMIEAVEYGVGEANRGAIINRDSILYKFIKEKSRGYANKNIKV